jgi:AcrR family transcriptional regulator
MTRATEPRKKPRQQRSREMAQRILQSAKSVLKNEGYNALTTIAIADRAGLSVGSLYQYFPNKEAIIVELVRDWHAQFRDAIGEIDDTTTAGGLAALEKRLSVVLRNIGEIYRDQKDLLPALEAMRTNAELQRIDKDQDEVIITLLSRLICSNTAVTFETAQRLSMILLASTHACFLFAASLDQATFEFVLQDVSIMFRALLQQYTELGPQDGVLANSRA